METIINDKKVLYNLQRFQILKTKLNPNTTNLIPDYYAYAWYCNLYPILDECKLHEDLEECFEVSKEQIEIISNWADSEWRKGNYHTFYQYEDHFHINIDSVKDISRYTLLATFRYLFLHRTFDDKFWEKLIESGKYPGEASDITSKFDNSEIYLM